jgi:hypothetical protein
MAQVERAITSGADLNTCVESADLFGSFGETGSKEGSASQPRSGPRSGKYTDGKYTDACTLLSAGCYNNHVAAVRRLLTIGSVDIDKGSLLSNRGPLFAAATCGHTECVQLLIEHGADMNIRTDDGQTALFAAATRGHQDVVTLLLEHGATQEPRWMGMSLVGIAQGEVLKILHGYESEFGGFISDERGALCTVSWPGVYAKSWDALVAGAKAENVSAAVVFLPQHTASFGAHGSDKVS